MTFARYSPHQLAYFAHKLTLQGASDSMGRTAGALFDAAEPASADEGGKA